MADPIETVNLGGYTQDMSMWGLFLQADPIVKAVMFILIAASVWSWSIIFSNPPLVISSIEYPNISSNAGLT